MALQVTVGELIKSLQAYLAAAEADGYSIGLYKNNFSPNQGTVIGDVEACDFGGYSGFQPLANWTVPVLDHPRVVSTADMVEWTADGTSANVIYGYYVIDSAGDLAWIEARPTGGFAIGTLGDVYRVVPRFTRRTEVLL